MNGDEVRAALCAGPRRSPELNDNDGRCRSTWSFPTSCPLPTPPNACAPSACLRWSAGSRAPTSRASPRKAPGLARRGLWPRLARAARRDLARRRRPRASGRVAARRSGAPAHRPRRAYAARRVDPRRAEAKGRSFSPRCRSISASDGLEFQRRAATAGTCAQAPATCPRRHRSKTRSAATSSGSFPQRRDQLALGDHRGADGAGRARGEPGAARRKASSPSTASGSGAKAMPPRTWRSAYALVHANDDAFARGLGALTGADVRALPRGIAEIDLVGRGR